MFRPFLFQNEIYLRRTTSFFFFLEQFQSHTSFIPDRFLVAQPGSFAPPGFEMSGGRALLSDPPGLPAAARRRPGAGAARNHQALTKPWFPFPLLSKILYQWTCWFCFWNPRWCIFYTTILPLSPILIFLSSIYLKVRSKYVLYKFPMFAIQAIVPLHSKFCDTGRNASISCSAWLSDPQLSSPSEKYRPDDSESPDLLPRKKHLFGNSLQDPGQENKTQTCKSHDTIVVFCSWLSALQTGRTMACKHSFGLYTFLPFVMFAVNLKSYLESFWSLELSTFHKHRGSLCTKVVNSELNLAPTEV